MIGKLRRTRCRAAPTSLVVVLLVSLLAGCVGSGSDSGPVTPAGDCAGPPATLRVLGGSELDDMRPILDESTETTGVTITLTEAPTLTGTQTVVTGQAEADYDAIWFSSNRYLSLHPGAMTKLEATEKIMYSPVILGLRTSTAQRLGWAEGQVGWADVARAAEQRKLTFGMTNPAESNSGLSALVGIATALTHSGSAVNAQQVAQVTPQLRAFFGAQALTSRSSGWLSEAYQRRDSHGPPVDGLINYESVLLSLNDSGTLREPLTLIYPSDGVVTADYPLTLLSSASDAAKSAYTRLACYLRTPAVQQEIMDRTHRRPAIPDVALADRFGRQRLFELPFPAQSTVVDDLITGYFNNLRRPARTVYLLDTSGSMAGPRIADLKAALSGLTGADTSLSGQVERFHNREQVTMLPFSSEPGRPVGFDVPEQNPQPVLDQIRVFSEGLSAGGDTAIYDSLAAAYDVLARQAATDPDRINSIVLMTDGENTHGRDLEAFRATYHQLSSDLKSVPVFPIVFGEGNLAEMENLVELTGGDTFDARTEPLLDVFKQIRGYQ